MFVDEPECEVFYKPVCYWTIFKLFHDLFSNLVDVSKKSEHVLMSHKQNKNHVGCAEALATVAHVCLPPVHSTVRLQP